MIKAVRVLKRVPYHIGFVLQQAYLYLGGRIASILQKNKQYKEDYPIDFVVTWVDGNDPEWRKEKQKYAGLISDQGFNGSARYRDWDTLVYWFRAVEKFAPWVNRVYFVTCGQKPKWLNLNNEKLRFVTHESFMPEEYLPTFNSCAIELNMWRIPDLSEHFVYFNDDTFLNRPVKPEDFFSNGLPKECAIAKPLYVNCEYSISWQRTLLNDLSVINKSFDIRERIMEHPSKWFSYIIGRQAKYNRRLYFDGYLAGMLYPHVSRAFMKNTFADLWNEHRELMDQTSRSKFRDSTNYTIQLVTLWMLFSGDFCPVRNDQLGVAYNVKSITIEHILEELNSPKHNVICINDGDSTDAAAYDNLKGIILDAFSKKLPEKSSFEL